MGHQRTADADAAGGKSQRFSIWLALALKVEEGPHHTAIGAPQNVGARNPAARTLQPRYSSKRPLLCRGIGVGGEGFTNLLLLPRQPVKGPRQARTFARPGAAYRPSTVFFYSPQPRSRDEYLHYKTRLYSGQGSSAVLKRYQ